MPSHEWKLSTTPMILTMTHAEMYEPRVYMVGGVSVRKWLCGGQGCSLDISFGCFVSFSSLLLYLFFGSRPGINGVGTGCYHFPMEVEFPHPPHLPKGRL